MLKKFKIIISILFIILIINIPIISCASSNPIDNPDDFAPGSVTTRDVNAITVKANQVIGAITTVGIVISFISLIFIGIKYMTGSVDAKADYKSSMVPYLIGMVFLLTTSVIVKIIAMLVQSTNLFK